MKTMTLDELKKLPPLTEEEIEEVLNFKDTNLDDPECPVQTKEELKKFRPWYEVHPDFYKPKKEAIYIRIDKDVLEWFKAQGKGYQTKINEALRKYAFN